MDEYWVCIIGPRPIEEKDPRAPADPPLRFAVKEAFQELTGHDAQHVWSGWGVSSETKDQILLAWLASFPLPLSVAALANTGPMTERVRESFTVGPSDVGSLEV